MGVLEGAPRRPDVRLGLQLAVDSEEIFDYKIIKYNFLPSRHKSGQRRKFKKEYFPSKL